MTPTPRVFISATSGDLSTARKAAVQALTTLGCLPVEQSHFTPDTRQLSDMLREKIKDCAAVLHIAGFRYGAEPSHREPGKPRRSYTQQEVDIAVELGKQIYILLPDEDFPFDADAPPEDEERRALQLEHRAALMKCGRHYTPVNSHALLREKLRELQVQVEELKRLLIRQDQQLKTSARRSLCLTVSVAVLIAFFAWDRVEAADEREQASKDLADLKRLIEERGLGAEAALGEVAAAGGKEPKELARAFDTFGKEVAADPNASAADKERAAFLNHFTDLNAFLAVADPGITEAAARIELEKREKQRDSFLMGVVGPWRFVFAFFGNVLTPHEAIPAFQRGGAHPEPQTPPKTAGEETESPLLRPINLEDYIRKPGSPPEPEPDNSAWSLISPAHWSSAAERAWDQTWGVGPGNYRVGFVFGCILIPLGLREDKLRREKKRMAKIQKAKQVSGNPTPVSKG